MKKIPIIVIVGPTSTGKTKLAIEIAHNSLGNMEIINADSMQVYKGMNIGTSKPTKEEMGGIIHHLIDVVEADEEFNLFEYIKLARNKICEINDRNKIPIIVGGTGLYIDSLIKNLRLDLVTNNSEIRSKLEEELNVYGKESLWNKLKSVDEQIAKKIHPNDVKRVIRAIELNYVMKQNIQKIYKKTKEEESSYYQCIIGLNYRDRNLLYDRINNRVDQMVNNGLIEEVKKLFISGFSKTANQAIGYKELRDYFEGKISLNNAIEIIKQRSRNYAKRQITWFKRNKDINWIYIDDYENFNDVICISKNLISKFDIEY